MDNSDIELQKYISATVQRTGSKSNTNYDDVSNEYDEYQALKEKFTGERLKKLVRKTDMRILPPLILIYLLTYVDRTNVGNAKLFGAAADLGMSGQQWNTALSVFFVTYALGGVPSQIGLKRWGPRTWLPIILTSISIVLVCTGLQNNFGGWTAFRMLLGLVEAGMYPGCSVVLTEYYAPDELQGRMTILYSGASKLDQFLICNSSKGLVLFRKEFMRLIFFSCLRRRCILWSSCLRYRPTGSHLGLSRVALDILH